MVSKKMRDGCGTFVPTLVDDAVDDDDDDDDDARRFGFVFLTIGRTDGRRTKRRSTAPNRDRKRGGTLTIRWCRQNDDGTKRREIAATATTRSGDDRRERRAGVGNEGARG